MTSLHQLDYRKLLREELACRMGKNPLYSLRAFARDLKVSSSKISEILNGKQGLSVARALQLVELLGWNEEKANFFCGLVTFKHSKNHEVKKAAFKQLVRSPYFKEMQCNLHYHHRNIRVPAPVLIAWVKQALKKIDALNKLHADSKCEDNFHFEISMLLEGDELGDHDAATR